MTSYGGMGGAWDGREIREDDAFEVAVERALGDAIRSDEQVGHEMWSALANVDWVHENGDDAGYTFRAAGDLVAAIRGSGMYMDWYCASPSGVVSERVEKAMATQGWRPVKYD